MTRPSAPDPAVFEEALCRQDPTLHDSRREREPEKVWAARFAEARLVCFMCPVMAECAQLREHAHNSRRGIDGIMAGQVAKYREKEHTPADKIRHGTASGYSNKGCRCGPCTEADRQARATARADRAKARVRINGRMIAAHLPTDAHGRAHTYNGHHCRCQPCTDAVNEARVERKIRQVEDINGVE